MARDGVKNTAGQKVENLAQELAIFGGLASGSVPAVYLGSMIESLSSPEGLILGAGAASSVAGGIYTGVRISESLEGSVADSVDALRPNFMKSGELYLNGIDPFEVFPDESDVDSLDTQQREQVRTHINEQLENHPLINSVNEDALFSFSDYIIESDEAEEWVEDIAFGEINGFDGEYRTSYDFCGAFKTGYVDRNEEVFIQAPRKGDTFQETLGRVKSWKQNKDVLDQADKYIEQVLANTGTKTVSKGKEMGEALIDYQFLRDNEEILREEVEDGILTPSENYHIVVTSHDGEPLPVLVGEYNPDMLEPVEDINELNIEKIEKRKQVLGMYMDTLIDEELLHGTPGDYWFQKSLEEGREYTKNMFYDTETDTVGITDIGEHRTGEINSAELPEISINQPYNWKT